MTIEHERPTHVVAEGPFSAEFAHAPVGTAIVGVVIGQLRQRDTRDRRDRYHDRLTIFAARAGLADTTMFVTTGLITGFALLIAVVVLRRLRRSVDPPVIESSHANFRAFTGVTNDAVWVVDVVERLEHLDARVDQLIERRPVSMRSTS